MNEFKPTVREEDAQALEEMDKPIKKGDNKAFKGSRKLRMKRAMKRSPQAEPSMDNPHAHAPGDVREAERKLRFATEEQKQKLMQELKSKIDFMKAKQGAGK